MTARVVCCGCQKEMGTKEGFKEAGAVTSTLCADCTERLYGKEFAKAVYKELAGMALDGRARFVQ